MLDNNKMLSSGVIRLDRLIMLRGKDKYNQKENSLEGELVPVFELCRCGSGLANAWCCISHTCVHKPAHTHTHTHRDRDTFTNMQTRSSEEPGEERSPLSPVPFSERSDLLWEAVVSEPRQFTRM